MFAQPDSYLSSRMHSIMIVDRYLLEGINEWSHRVDTHMEPCYGLPACELRGDAVHLVYVSRGAARLAPVVRSLQSATMWTSTPHRLTAHVLADRSTLADAEDSFDLTRRAKWGCLLVYNATDAAMRPHLSKLGRATLDHPRLAGKAHLFTAPKLFLFELLRHVPSAILLDNDMLFLADVCTLWDQHARLTGGGSPYSVFAYALEQARMRPRACLYQNSSPLTYPSDSLLPHPSPCPSPWTRIRHAPPLALSYGRVTRTGDWGPAPP